ncbi:MAG: hypothetical protein IM594_14290 [Cytophagales bacterium]|jgi:hypothetical protein|nr:hypothetical protein [Cytophagales bacterium]MCA6389419.1 hypothetical protein [Cytophagales bacterium]MCA6392290.1 hypothetical protein [Cytophagales bacterium]MCA6398113.1 hypothetical protein [Cytophagales bacterium]MCA6400538.1 hypothetical protein [Cytophagales bacterium]
MRLLSGLCSLTFFLSSTFAAFSQVAIGTGATAPNLDTSAVLLLEGNGSQGIIIPKVSSLGSFGKPGMVVYNTATGTVYYFSTKWVELGTGGSAAQGIQISGNKVSIGTGAGFTPDFSIAAVAPGANGQILMWDTSLNSGAGGWTSSATTAPSAVGQVLKWNGSRWEPGTDNTGSTTTLSGDVSGPSNNSTISITAGNSIAAALNNAATTSKILPAQISAGAAGQVLTTTGGVAVWATPAGSALPSLSANQILSNNGTNTAINVAGDIGLSVSGTTGTFTVANNAITSAKLANNAVDATKIANGAVGLNQLANGPANNVLTTNASGVPQWTVAAGGGDMLKSTYDPTNINGSAFNLSNHTGQVGATQITDASITGGTTGSGVKIAANTITDANISSTAAIAGTKIAPAFGAQNITTTTGSASIGGGLNVGLANGFTVNNSGNITKINGATTSFPATNAVGVLTNDGTGTFTWAPAGGGSVSTVSVVNANGFNGSVANATSTPAITIGTSLTGLLKGTGTGIGSAAAGTDYQAPITLTTTGTSGVATLVGNTLNVPNYAGTAYIAGTGLTLTGNTFSVNGSQNISTLSNLTANGLIKTSGGTGTLSIATAGTDYLTPTGNGSGLTNLNASNISSGTLPVAQVPNLDAAKITTGSFASTQITDGTIVDADVNTAAAIAGTKILPNFGTQAVTSGAITATSAATTISATTSTNSANQYAISGITTGTGDAAGFFLVNNPGNGFPAVYGETRGTNGIGVYGSVGNTGIGSAGVFANLNPANNNPVLRVLALAGSGSSIKADGLIETVGFRLTGGAPGAGKVLTSDASGNAAWQTGGGSGWGLTGNAGTVDGTNFIGTTDDIPFSIRVNNQQAMRISFTGATSAPNILAGYSGNTISNGVVGSAILSGGLGGQINQVTDNYSVVGGGSLNSAGNNDADPGNAGAATVSGGNFNKASSSFATVGGGYNNQASGNSAVVAGGRNATASGEAAGVLSGEVNQATGFRSAVVGGNASTASGANSFVGGGEFNGASGNFSAVSGGGNNLASGDMTSIPGGRGLFARSFGETAVGIFNIDYTPTSTTSFTASDRLFVIGNGTDFSSRSNALTVLKNGNVGIGTTTPISKLNVSLGQWDLVNSEGDFSIGDGTHRLKMGVSGGGGGAGDAYIASQGGTNRLFLGNSNSLANSQTLTLVGGNVGIGTSAPTNRLHINEPSAAGNFLRITNNPSPNGLTLGLSGAGSQEAFIANNENAAMYFQTNAANRMAITAVGNVGIGTILPNAQLQFANVTGNRKLVLWESANNDHEYYGFGVNGGEFRYQIPNNTGSQHRFYAATGTTSSLLQMSIGANGNVAIAGNLSKGSGTFKIDHPQDPENKYLYHSFVESPDMMNVYNGNITTDVDGNATVKLPAYFESLNKDFRYQLTVIGAFAQAIVASEVNENKFVIKTDKPNIKVSWQVTGIRKDPYAEQNRVVPEMEKPAKEKGKYLHPEAYGLPLDRSVNHVSDKKENN